MSESESWGEKELNEYEKMNPKEKISMERDFLMDWLFLFRRKSTVFVTKTSRKKRRA
jgi:hypothetical protein